MKEIPSIHTDVVSFDLFDDIIIRPFVKPIDFFNYMEEIYRTTGFVSARINAEKRVRSDCTRGISLDDIYSYLPQYLEMKNKECSTELKLAIPNTTVIDLIKKLKNEGKKIVLISDSYLPSEVISSMMKKVGVEYDRIYISSEKDLPKNKKDLFKYALEDMSLDPTNLTHVGVGKRSGHKVLWKMGIHLITIRKPITDYLKKNLCERSYYKKKKTLSSSIIVAMNCISDAEMNKEYSIWEEIGFKFGGPLIYSFVKFIHSHVDRKSKLFFTARDGYSLIKEYEMLFPGENECYYVNLQRIIFNCLCDNKLLTNEDVVLPNKIRHVISYRRTVLRIRSILSFFSNDLGIDSIPIDVKELLHLYNERKSDIQLCRDSENYILSEKYKMFSAGGDVNLIDCNTMNYTSQRLLEFFIERKVHGIYLHSLKKSSCSYDAMCRQGRGLIHWFKVNISEFLLCSNELPLKGMCGGSPIFLTGPKSEKDRAAHYEEILRGIDRYCNDMKKIFGDMMPDFDYDSVIEWASFVKKHGTKYRKVVSEIKWASDYNHNNWKSILPLKQPIKSIKGLIDSVLGHLFPEK